MRNWGPFLFSILLGAVLAVISVLPPAPKSVDAPAGVFSAARAMEDIRIIAAKPHPTGSAENAVVRAYLLSRLRALGLEAFETEGDLPERSLARLNRWSGAEASSQTFVNVIGVMRGKDSTKPALLLMAHHDTVWGSPGAADDTIGIASIFEILRAVNEGKQPDRDIIVLLTDAEELGLDGARHAERRDSAVSSTHPRRIAPICRIKTAQSQCACGSVSGHRTHHSPLDQVRPDCIHRAVVLNLP